MGRQRSEGRGREVARSVWLAGLGLVAAVGEETSVVFEGLVKEGRRVEKREKAAMEGLVKRARKQVEGLRRQAADLQERAEHGVQGAMASALNRLGVPTRNDIAELRTLVERLGSKVQGLESVN